MSQFRLWDAPLRIFHWSLVVLVVAAVVSGQVGGTWMIWHGRIGLAIVGLITFRLCWGLWGSTYARFSQFFPTLASIRAYLAGNWRGAGHNPLGAVSVFGLLALLTARLLTGLPANDDIAFRGPLYALVGADLSGQLTGLHHLLSNVLMVLVVLHVGAIAYYAHFKKRNLLRPMLTGWQAGDAQSAKGGGWGALLVALLIAGLAVFAASGVWIPKPPPLPPVDVPTW